MAAVVSGLALGVFGAILASRLIGSLTFDVTLFDPVAWTPVLLLGVAGAIPCYTASRHATRAPIVAIQSE